VNLALLLSLLAGQVWPAAAQGSSGVLRGSALEIVDAAGRVRASIGVLPPDAGNSSGGETVLLRLIDAAGQPSVKISASGASAGLSFTGGDDLSYVILQADGAKPMLKLSVGGGGERVIKP
jgi:hypothetical protein